jgi:deoxycytidylate deaminase
LNNFIIGLTGAFGSGCSSIAENIYVKEFGFIKYSLSDIVRAEFEAANGCKSQNRHELQAFGNKIREEKKVDYLAKETIKKIQEDGISSTQDIIIDSLRNPAEIEFLRQVCPNFFLVAIFADYQERWERVKSTYGNKKDDFDTDEYKDQGNDEPAYGQKVTLCFFEADLILSNNKYINFESPNEACREMIGKIDNYIQAFKNPKSSQPTINESLMAIAYTNGRRSKCKKRRVGAIIVDEFNNILSSGFNDVPKGLQDCSGEYGECYRDKCKRERKEQIVNDLAGIPENDTLANKIIKNIKLLELCRALHAEENAILNLVGASGGIGLARSALYVTTYPCNLCANKISQKGIKKVIYLEPYTVIEAKKIFEDSGVNAVPFEGVTFRAFFRAFTFEA